MHRNKIGINQQNMNLDSIVDVRLQVVRMVAENWALWSLRIEPFKQEGRAPGTGARPSPYGSPWRLLWLASTGRIEQATVPLAPANDIRPVNAARRSRSGIARTLRVSQIAVAEYADISNTPFAAPLHKRSARPAFEGKKRRT